VESVGVVVVEDGTGGFRRLEDDAFGADVEPFVCERREDFEARSAKGLSTVTV
jgi:hypothetical protein